MATNIKSSWLAGPASCNLLETNILEASLLEAHLLENRCSKPLSLKLLKIKTLFCEEATLLLVRQRIGGLPRVSNLRLLGGELRGPRGPAETCNNVKSRATKCVRQVERNGNLQP